MVHGTNKSRGEFVKAAAIALEQASDAKIARQALCRAVYECVEQFLTVYVRKLLPWYQEYAIDDLLHETFASLFAKAIAVCESGQLDLQQSGETIAAFFRSVARNLLLDQLRKSISRQNRVCLQLLEDVEESNSIAKDIEDSDEVKSLFRAIGAKDRELIRMRIFDDLSYAEIAARKGQTINAVRVAFHRAIERLRSVAAGRKSAT